MRPAVLPLGRPDVPTEEVIRLRDVEHLTWAAIGEALGAPDPINDTGAVTAIEAGD